jgi:hypothetical protein
VRLPHETRENSSWFSLTTDPVLSSEDPKGSAVRKEGGTPEGPAGKPVPLLVLRAGPGEREALLSIGHPFFASRAGRDRVVVVLTGDTDWEEIGELVTDSYRILAPKKLTALLG